MVVTSIKVGLLERVEPFSLQSGRRPSRKELKDIEAVVHDLENESDTAVNLARIGGTWECLFTTSRFVLGLDKIPLLRLSAVYQKVVVDPGAATGCYLNIAELSRAGTAKLICGEYATIRASQSEPQRLDVQYEWFYFAVRAFASYEGQPLSRETGAQSDQQRREWIAAGRKN